MTVTRRALSRFVLSLGQLLLLATLATAKDVPFLVSRVTDHANLLSESVANALEDSLKQLEARTGAQVAVLLEPSLEGEVLEQYTEKVATTWKLGSAEKDNGVLFYVARDDRKMRLEVGYGLEGTLPDATCRRILDNVVRPRFKAGDFDEGVTAGVAALSAAIRGEAVEDYAGSDGEGSGISNGIDHAPLQFRLVFMGIFLLVVGLFSTIAIFAERGSWPLYFFLMPFHLLFPMVGLGVRGGLLWFLAWVIGFPILRLWLHRSSAGKAFRKRHPRLRFENVSTGSGSSWSGSSGSSSSGSSFSGGGGSFGGGGSSSSW